MNNHKNKGVTLIELLITIAIVGIFASIALPSFSKLIENNRISTATNELVANMMLARSEALKRGDTVTMCPSTDQDTCNATDPSLGWVVFLDCTDSTDPNCQKVIIKVGDGFDSVDVSTFDEISFGFSGRPTGGLQTLTVKGKQGNSELEKTVILSRIGRVRTESNNES